MIPTFRPTIRRVDMDSVLTRLAQDSIGVGALSREFAQGTAKYLGRRYGVAVRSPAAALRCALAVLGLEPGRRVGISALAAGWVYRVIVSSGLTPVLLDTERRLPILPSPLDVDYRQFALDALYVDTRLGYVPPIATLRELGLPVIEDVSEGLGAHTGDALVGSSGELTLLSVEADSVLTAGGGAVLVTSSSKRASRMAEVVGEHLGEPALSDMNAALGLTQLRQLARFLERRREIAARFLRAVEGSAHQVPTQTGEAENVFFALPLLVSSSPRDVESYARTNGVAAERAFRESALTVARGPDDDPDGEDSPAAYPNALALAGRVLLFPLFPALSGADQDRIIRVLSTLP